VERTIRKEKRKGSPEEADYGISANVENARSYKL
jgi:hypothetical protein